MKTMTCKQLGGACDKAFHAETFEEIAEMAKNHGMEMYEQSDEEHLNAMNKMMERMKDPSAMQAWMDGKRKEFDELQEE